MLKVENRSFGQAGKRIKHPCVEKNETVHCLATVTFTAGRQGNKTYKMLREGGHEIYSQSKSHSGVKTTDSFEHALSEEILFPRALWKMILKDKL